MADMCEEDAGHNFYRGKTRTLWGWWRRQNGGVGWGATEATETVRWKNFRRQRVREKEEGQTENGASLSLLMADCRPSGLNHDL